MGIFRKKDKSDDSVIFETDIEQDQNAEEVLKIPEQMFDENIGFETGVLKNNFTNIKHNSESLDVIRKKVVKKSNVQESENTDYEKADFHSEETNDDEDYRTLLEKCKPYTIDENGNDFSEQNQSLYELKSVAEILKSDHLKALDFLSKKYNIEFEDESDNDDKDDSNVDTERIETSEPKQTKTENFVKLTQENLNSGLSDDQMFEDYILKTNSDATIEQVNSDIPDISDIDNSQKINPQVHDHSTDGATLRYIPVKDSDDTDGHISISSTTQNIDLGSKLNVEIPDQASKPQSAEDSQDDFEDYKVEDEITDTKSLSSQTKKIALRKRGTFLASIFSVLLTIIISVLSFNYFQDSISNSPTVLIVCSAIYLFNCFTNISIYSSFAKIFKKQIDADFLTAVLSVSTIIMALINLFKFDGEYASDTYFLILVSSVILSVRCLCNFFAVSSKLGNLKSISSKSELFAIDFIEDQSIAYSIAKDSVDGDILIAAPHKTKFINSFNRFSTYTSLLSGNFLTFQIIGIIFALCVGFLGLAKSHSLTGGINCFISVMCLLAFPVLYFINSLPCYSASKKLNKSGAAIFGTAGAEKLENANAVVISTDDLFPSGSIILKDIKILSENNIDDTLLRAASLTEAVGSTLTPIFKKIAKTNSTYTIPDSDTVKYENELGLSGWVDNELLFIGNRSLMQSHGIEVPSYEIDKRILQNDCFPIYVATVDKACALLIVKYNPSYEIAKELRKLSSLGVTLLFTNSDPNISEKMIADYFDVYEDSIKIVSNAGKHMYDNYVFSNEPMASPATFKRHNLAFVKLMNAASAIKKSNTLFSVIYIIAAILSAVAFVYLKFASDITIFDTKYILLTEMIISIFSLIIYLFKKP